MSVSVEEQLRMLGRAFGEFVDEVGVDDVLETTRTTPAMRTVSMLGMTREFEHPTPGDRIGAGAFADQKPRWRRGATLVAAAFVLVAGVVGVLVVAQRPVDAPSGPTSPPPAWYSALAPLLPDGYEHVAVLQSHQSFVEFEAFNPDSSKSLSFTVSRSAMLKDRSGVTMTLAEAQAEPWTDPNLEYDISLPDGRQVGVYCWFRAMPENEPSCPDVDGHRTDPEMLRTFAVALATELSPDDLPTRASELHHVTTATIRSTINGLDPDAGIELEAPHYSFAFVQHGNGIDRDVLIVRTVSGFHPPFPADTQRATASFNGHRLTWQPIGDDTIWYVSDNPSSGLDVADEILDRAAGVTDIERSIIPPSSNSDDLTDPATTTLGALVAPELPGGFELVYTVDSPVPFAVAVDPDGNRLEMTITSGPLALREVDRVESDLRRDVPEGRLAVGPDGRVDERAAYLVTDDAIITVTYTRTQDTKSVEPGSAVRIARTIARTMPPELVTGLDGRVGTALLREVEARLGSFFDRVTSSGGTVRVPGVETIEVSGDVDVAGTTVQSDVRVELFHGQLAPRFIEAIAGNGTPERYVRRVGPWLMIVTANSNSASPPLDASQLAAAVADVLEDDGYTGACPIGCVSERGLLIRG